jgi:biopolymer transport protein ExbB
MIEEFGRGGTVMWFLLACMLLGLAIFFERAYSLLIKIRLNPRVFLDRLISAINENGLNAGIGMCDRTPSPVAKVLKAALEKADRGREAIEDAITRAASTELAFLDRGMGLFAGLTTVAPFFGFLGTVTGMMKSFAAIAAAGEVEPTIVASGISEALITTKWGLLIACPLAIIHILFTGKVDAYTKDMEEAAAGLVDFIQDHYPATKEQRH